VTEQPAPARARGDRTDGALGAMAPARAAGALRIAGWAVVYAVAVWLGHLTVVEPTTDTLFWPASGVAALWVASTGRRTRLLALVLVGAVGAATLVGLDASRWQVVEALVGGPVAAAVFVLTARLWSSRRSGSLVAPIETLRQYGGLVAAAIAASAAEAVVALATLAFDPGGDIGAVAPLTASHTAATVTIAATGLVVATWFAALPVEGSSVRALPGRIVAGIRRDCTRRDLAILAGAIAVATAVFVTGYVLFEDAPVSFVLMMLTVAFGIRFTAPSTGLFALAVTTVACVFTAVGNGPIAHIAEPHRRPLAFGLFAVALVATGLTIALSRRERDDTIHRLRESERKAEVTADDLSLVLATLEEGVAVVEEGGRFIHANEAIGRLLVMPDFDDQQVQPVETYQLTHLDGRPLLESEIPHVRAFAGEDEVHDVLRLNRPDMPGERIFEVHSRRLPQIRSTDKPRAVTMIRDVTTEHAQRDALTSFAQVVAHDLRNPLTSVELWAQELLESYQAGPVAPETATMMLRHVASAAGRMQNFISDLLSYALARDQTPSPVRLDLADVVESVVETMTAVEGVEPDVRYAELPEVWCDPVLMPQLFDNLVGNARKYVAPGTVPRVRIEATPLPDDWTLVRVTDNGIGIAREDRLRVFETFERARAAEYEGTGLGLSICRHIVERHGGTIAAADPPPGCGSCIELTLPRTEGAFTRAFARGFE
jgi:signal transduction histidine kinase